MHLRDGSNGGTNRRVQYGRGNEQQEFHIQGLTTFPHLSSICPIPVIPDTLSPRHQTRLEKVAAHRSNGLTPSVTSLIKPYRFFPVCAQNSEAVLKLSHKRFATRLVWYRGTYYLLSTLMSKYVRQHPIFVLNLMLAIWYVYILNCLWCNCEERASSIDRFPFSSSTENSGDRVDAKTEMLLNHALLSNTESSDTKSLKMVFGSNS